MEKSFAGKFHVEPPFTSLDHLVGKREQPVRNLEAKRLRGLEIDDQLESSRLQNWQFGGVNALENLAGVDAHLTIQISKAGSVADQPTSRRQIANLVHRGHRMACRECHDPSVI